MADDNWCFMCVNCGKECCPWDQCCSYPKRSPTSPEHTCHDERRSIEDAFLEWIRPIEETRPDRLDCFTAGYAAGRKSAMPTREEFEQVEENARSYTGGVEPLDAYWAYDYLASRIEGEK